MSDSARRRLGRVGRTLCGLRAKKGTERVVVVLQFLGSVALSIAWALGAVPWWLGLIGLAILAFTAVELVGSGYYRSMGPFHGSCPRCDAAEVQVVGDEDGWRCPAGHIVYGEIERTART